MRLQSFKCNINFQACILPAAGRFGGGRRVPGGRAGAKSHCGLHETALLPSPNGSSFSQPAVMVSASSPFPVRSAELPACDPQTRISPQAVGSWAAAGGAPLAHPAPRPASMGSRPLCSWGITRCWSQTGSPGGDGQHTWTVLSVCILCSWHLLACQDAPFWLRTLLPGTSAGDTRPGSALTPTAARQSIHTCVCSTKQTVPMQLIFPLPSMPPVQAPVPFTPIRACFRPVEAMRGSAWQAAC